MAHYHMGGIRVSTNMESRIKGLYAAGEAVGGANGANRLSGNADHGGVCLWRAAGSSAARAVQQTSIAWNQIAVDAHAEPIRELTSRRSKTASLQRRVKLNFKTSCGKWWDRFARGISLPPRWSASRPYGASCRISLLDRKEPFNLDIQDWLELRAMLATAEMVVTAALARTESRGAHHARTFQIPTLHWRKTKCSN